MSATATIEGARRLAEVRLVATEAYGMSLLMAEAFDCLTAAKQNDAAHLLARTWTRVIGWSVANLHDYQEVLRNDPELLGKVDRIMASHKAYSTHFSGRPS